MYAMGFSLNQLTLLGLSLAIGLLIDDAVVVRESITRRLERGDPPARAASEGTREIALAVMATTFTLVAVFVPVAFMKGITGQFFRQFGLTITVAVLISLFVAFTLDPMLSARLARARACPARRARAAWRSPRIRAAFDADRPPATRARSTGCCATAWSPLAGAALLFLASLGVGGGLGTRVHAARGPQPARREPRVPARHEPRDDVARSAALERQVQAIPGVVAVYATVGPRRTCGCVRWRVNLVDKRARAEAIEAFKERDPRHPRRATPRCGPAPSPTRPSSRASATTRPSSCTSSGRDFGRLARGGRLPGATRCASIPALDRRPAQGHARASPSCRSRWTASRRRGSASRPAPSPFR